MKSAIRYLCAAALFLFGMNLCFAQQPAPPPDKAAEKPKEEKKPPAPEEKVVQTKHSLKIGGQEIKYTATAGLLSLRERLVAKLQRPHRKKKPSLHKRLLGKLVTRSSANAVTTK